MTGAGGGAGGGIDDTPEVDGDEPPVLALGAPIPLELAGEPEHFRHIRLTHDQWENSVRDILRLTAATGWREMLEPDVRAPSAYGNNEELLYVGAPLVVDYADVAEALAQETASDPELLAAVYSGSDAAGFIEDVGRRFYRRPLTTEEAASLEAIFERGSTLPSANDEFSGGAGLVLEVLLQSPRFLYRIESAAEGERLNGYELATKLAYFITNTTPSDALLDQAAAGALDSDDGLRAIAEELLGSPAARATLKQFHAETYDFERFANISKNPDVVPEYAEGTSAELEQAAELFFDHVFQQGLGVRDIFTSDVAFASDEMAALYEVEGAGSAELAPITLGPERPGFLTQLPFLISYSVNLTPLPIARGAAINYQVLCADVPPDVAAVSDLPVPMGQTNRERVTSATEAPGCEGCHRYYLNPLGFAFENFDGLGRARELDDGLPVDTTGSYPFVEGQLEFSGAPELMQLLAESQQVHRCYAAHLSEYGLAHELGPDDGEVVEALTARSLDELGSLSELIVDLVASRAFHTRRGSP
jgi:hypothetical protein